MRPSTSEHRAPRRFHHTLAALLAAAALLALPALLASCSDSSGGKPDSTATSDANGGKDGSGSKDVGAGDGPAADQPAGADGPVADRGADSIASGDGATDTCRQASQRCGGDNGKCCSGLTCCTGVPVPAGQEYCAAICPKSDRNIKYNVRAVDEDKLLRQLMSLPISSWTYNNEPSRIRHIGPMAQDFKKVFGVGGDDDRFIAPVDADCVSLLAIMAIYRRLQRLEKQAASTAAENRALRRLLARWLLDNRQSCTTH